MIVLQLNFFTVCQNSSGWTCRLRAVMVDIRNDSLAVCTAFQQCALRASSLHHGESSPRLQWVMHVDDFESLSTPSGTLRDPTSLKEGSKRPRFIKQVATHFSGICNLQLLSSIE